MNQTHLHLIITHLPIYASILGTLILVYGLKANSAHTRKAAYMVLLIAAIGGIIAYSTGEAAEHTAEKISGISKDLIEEHEEFAEGTLVAIIILGVVSLGGLMVEWKSARFSKAVALIVLIISLVTAGMVSWTGYLGGKIRHTEISQTAATVYYSGDGVIK
jgi:uncharacterized membrane protein